MSRFVIRHPHGGLYTGNTVTKTTYESVPDNPTVAAPRAWLAPQFDTRNVLGAQKYETHEDAVAILAHPDLEDPTAFAGCEVMEVEFDRHDPQALRPQD